MEIQEILTAISTVGFPIVACGALFWMQNKESERHKSEMDQIKTALENNTKAVTILAERLGGQHE